MVVLERDESSVLVMPKPALEPRPSVEERKAYAARLREEAAAIKSVVDVLAYLEEDSVHRVLNVVVQLMPQTKSKEAELQNLGALALSLGED